MKEDQCQLQIKNTNNLYNKTVELTAIGSNCSVVAYSALPLHDSDVVGVVVIMLGDTSESSSVPQNKEKEIQLHQQIL